MCRAKSAWLPSMCRAKSALHPFQVRSKFAVFAPSIEGSNADFALHMDGSHADFAPHIVSKSRRASKYNHWFESNSDFTKGVGFCLLVELHWEGSVSSACAAGLFRFVAKTQ